MFLQEIPEPEVNIKSSGNVMESWPEVLISVAILKVIRTVVVVPTTLEDEVKVKSMRSPLESLGVVLKPEVTASIR